MHILYEAWSVSKNKKESLIRWVGSGKLWNLEIRAKVYQATKCSVI